MSGSIYVTSEHAALREQVAHFVTKEVDPLAASQALRRLRDADLLQQKGRSSATYYVPTAETLGSQSGNPTALSGKSLTLSGNPAALSDNPQVGQVEESAKDRLLATLSQDQRHMVSELGERSTPELVKEAIFALCKKRPWRAEDLGLLLNRSVKYVRDQYLRPLLRSSSLVLTIPEEPTHPDQAYIAADDAKIDRD